MHLFSILDKVESCYDLNLCAWCETDIIESCSLCKRLITQLFVQYTSDPKHFRLYLKIWWLLFIGWLIIKKCFIIAYLMDLFLGTLL